MCAQSNEVSNVLFSPNICTAWRVAACLQSKVTPLNIAATIIISAWSRPQLSGGGRH